MIKGILLIVFGLMILALVGGGLGQIVVGLIGGLVGLVAGLFGLVVGLIGGILGIIVAVGTVLFIILLPFIILGMIVKALVC